MANLAPSGEVRRRKNPQNSTKTSLTSNGDDGSSAAQKKSRSRPSNGHNSDEDSDKAPRFSATTANKPASKTKNEYDEYAWFVVFLAALSYFIITRGGSSNRGGVLSSFSKPYNVIASSVDASHGNGEQSDKMLRSIFYIAKQQGESSSSLILEPNRRLEVIISSPPDIEDDHDKECTSNDDGNNSQKEQQSIPYLSHLSSTTWVHDEELGRGYLLLADAGRSGRIWRWEVGGGPITIGRSLHMERSGCRSGLWVDEENGNSTCPDNLFGESACSKPLQSKQMSSSSLFNPPLLGSASIAVELTRNAERSSAGANIIIAEWGERRIVRLEGETGARTPLVTLVPYYDSKSSTENSDGKQLWRRVFRPNHLTYTPFGDLLFSDNNVVGDGFVGVVYRRREAVHVAPIAADQSRNAHGWRGTTDEANQGDDGIDILFQMHGVIDGMALGLDFTTLYVLVTTQGDDSSWAKTIYKLSLSVDDDEDVEGVTSDMSKDANKATVLYKTSSTDCKENEADRGAHDPSSASSSKLAVDEKGTMYVIACPSSVTLLSHEDGHVVGTLAPDRLQKPQHARPLTSVSFGEDGYLYITSANELMRVKSRVHGIKIPTDLVVPPPLKVNQSDQ